MMLSGARRRALSIGGVAVVALVVAACGPSASDGEGGTAATDAAATDAGAPATEGGETASEPAAEGAEASCYEGQTATFVVSFGAGSNYDAIARLLAPILEEELGATVVVENQDGAGGLVAANTVFTAAPDGLTFGFFSGQGIAGSVLGAAAGVQFELLDFSYVARIAADQRLLVVGAQTDFETIEDVRGGETLEFASAGPGGSDHIDATVLFPVLGIDGEIITGFAGGTETELAVTSGDTDAMSGTVAARLPAVERGEHRGVLLIGEERIPELPDVPALLELDLDEQEMALAEAHTTLQQMGRLVLAPPEVPEDCLTDLRDAFQAAVENPDFVAQMQDAEQPIDFLDGEEAGAVAESVLDSPEEYSTLLEEAYQGQ